MKRLLTLFCLSFLALNVRGRVEFVRRSEITRTCLNAVGHITDKDGTTYLLAFTSPFYNDNYGRCGSIGSGNTYLLYKISPGGEMVWERPVLNDAGFDGVMFIKDSLIFIPHTRPAGCVNRMKGGGTMESYSSMMGGLLIRKSDGTPVKKVSFSYKDDTDDTERGFYLDEHCPRTYLLTAVLHKDNSITYIDLVDQVHRGEPTKIDRYGPVVATTHRLQAIERNDTLGFVSKDFKGSIVNTTRGCIMFDDFADQYVIADSAGIFIYNRDWSLARHIVLPHGTGFTYPGYKMALNGQYYVINYGLNVHSYKPKSYTAVYKKSGELISEKETTSYEAIGIDRHNTIYAIPQIVRYTMLDSMSKPVTLTCMDIHQEVVKEQHIGKPYVIANAISFTDKEIIITGTARTTITQQLPKTPDGIYYYKARIHK